MTRLARLLTCCVALAMLLSLESATRADTVAADLPEEGKVISSVTFRGNRKTEDDAIRLNMTLEPRQKLSSERLRDDLKAIWRMGYFDDLSVEAEPDGDKVKLVIVVREKPTIRKIYVAGSREVGLDKINEVLDLKKEAILDISKVKRNVDKVREMYIEKGYYLVDVSYEIQRKSDTEVDVYFNVDEHAKVEVRQVRFLGNKALSSDELKKVVGTQEGGFLSFITSSGTYREESFDRDIMMLTAYYYDKGYINVKMGKPEVELSSDKRYLYITIPIEEGLPYSIGKIDIRGDLLESREAYLKRMVTKSGEMFSRSRLGQDIQKLTDRYKDAGYANVNISPVTNIDADKRIIDVTYDVQKGDLVYFGRIQIRGNNKTRDKVIRRELRIYEGELYNQTRLDRSRALVQSLGFFEKVEMSTKAIEGQKNKIDVIFEVSERSTGTFQIGAGFSSIENFIAQAQIAQNNLFGRGTMLQLSGQFSSLRQIFSLRYNDRYFLDTKITFGFGIYNNTLYYPSFNSTSRGGDLTWGYLLTDRLHLSGTYKLEHVSVNQNQAGVAIGGFAPSTIASSGTVTNLFRSGWTSSIRVGLSYDSRNDRMFPTKGMFHALSVEWADPLIASEQVFARFTGFLRFYQPIWRNIIFRTNINAGLVISRSSQGVPINNRSFLGGINSIRGFNLFSLGPKVNVLQSQDPNAFLTQFNIGGNLDLVLNAEIEFPIFSAVQIKGVVFFDMGNAYNLETARYCTSQLTVSNISQKFSPCNAYPTFSNLRYSAGFGFRWVSPIGPLRFEWGLPLDRQTGEDAINFQFTIGNFF